MNELSEVIRQFPMFHARDDNTIEALKGLLLQERFSEGSCIFKQDDNASQIYFVVSGCVALSGKLATGEDFDLENIQEGAIFGEVACFGRGVRTATAVAATDTVLLVARDPNQLMLACPFLAAELCRVMAHRLDRLSQQMEFQMPTVREALASSMTPLDRATDGAVRMLGQYWAVATQILIIVAAILLSWNGATRVRNGAEVVPTWMDAGLWSLILAAIVMIVTALVLASERRQREDARKRDEVWDAWRQDVQLLLNHLNQSVSNNNRANNGEN